MAVKASNFITLSSVIDVKATYRYYLLQSSTLAKPNKPTTHPPGTSWSNVEPTYTDGSTNTLYFVDCTVFCDDTFSYSEVSVSSSYEAAKAAYNKAVNAQQSADNAAKVATNYIKIKDEGLIIGNLTNEVLGRNVLIDIDSVDIRNGDTVLASYQDECIYLGKQSSSATIDLCDGMAQITNEGSDMDLYRLALRSRDSIGLYANGAIYNSIFYDDGNGNAGGCYLNMESYTPWGADTSVAGRFELESYTGIQHEQSCKLTMNNQSLIVETSNSLFNCAAGLELISVEGYAGLFASSRIRISSTRVELSGYIDVEDDIEIKGHRPILANKKTTAGTSTSYYGLMNPDGTDSGWLRATQSGIIPHANGVGSIGASSWKFVNGYFQNVYGDTINGGTIEGTKVYADNMQYGTVSITPDANQPTSLSITFPTGAFEKQPKVFVTAVTTVIGSNVKGVAVSGATTTNVKLWIYRSNKTSTNLFWFAYGT